MNKQLDTHVRTPCCFCPYIDNCYEYRTIEDMHSFDIMHILKCRYCYTEYVARLSCDYAGSQPYVTPLHMPNFKEHSL